MDEADPFPAFWSCERISENVLLLRGWGRRTMAFPKIRSCHFHRPHGLFVSRLKCGRVLQGDLREDYDKAMPMIAVNLSLG